MSIRDSRAANKAKADAAGYEFFEYIGPDDLVTCRFCRRLVDRIHSRAEIDALDNGHGPGDVWVGGCGPDCRHHWRAVRRDWFEPGEWKRRRGAVDPVKRERKVVRPWALRALDAAAEAGRWKSKKLRASVAARLGWVADELDTVCFRLAQHPGAEVGVRVFPGERGWTAFAAIDAGAHRFVLQVNHRGRFVGLAEELEVDEGDRVIRVGRRRSVAG